MTVHTYVRVHTGAYWYVLVRLSTNLLGCPAGFAPEMPAGQRARLKALDSRTLQADTLAPRHAHTSLFTTRIPWRLRRPCQGREREGGFGRRRVRHLERVVPRPGLCFGGSVGGVGVGVRNLVGHGCRFSGEQAFDDLGLGMTACTMYLDTRTYLNVLPCTEIEK
jgi:hypothetical protein